MDILYDKAVKFVDDSFGKKKDHYVRTVYWLLELNPAADEALKIAAYAHDIERAFQDREKNSKTIEESEEGFMESKMMEYHQQRGGEIIKEFLLKHGSDDEITDRVIRLISKHEVGGDNDQNLLKDADSISFLECNVGLFIDVLLDIFGYQKCKDKFNFMFDRITSEGAKEIAKPMYENAIKRLDIVVI